IIEKYPFNEKIIRYGHEDSLFQMELEKHGLTIRFIRNPVIHIGLETNSRFIDKTQESVRNLYDLYASGVFNNMDIGKIRLLKTYILLRKWKADGLVNQLFPVMNWLNRKTNANGRPNLRVFDLYKLTFLTHIARSYSQIQQNQ
ncbi:MAG: hypothetical protein LBB85_06670, partial [Dysgonamonadaceae bacterium]|nr:hypothetical protein [Dysgonamonadaceae bacterium]